jgi:hypothetical protein
MSRSGDPAHQLHASPVVDLRSAIVRLHPDVDLVVFDRLDPAARARIGAVADDPAYYGLLSRRGADGRESARARAMIVDRDAALLLLTLRAPGAVPRYAWRAMGGAAAATLVAWVRDRILEVADGAGYACGPAVAARLRDGAAAPSLAWPETVAGPADDAIGRLSREAIRHAIRLPIREVEPLVRRLYRFNTLPAPRAERGGEPTDAEIGIGTTAAVRLLARGWIPVAHTDGDPWAAWITRAVPDYARDDESCKLYVSPMPADVRTAFPATLAALTRHRPLAIKVACGAAGLRRPDKMVVYFATPADLAEAAQSVAGVLDGLTPHGVPFSASITADGLLSWGSDPADPLRAAPRPPGSPAGYRAPSWRQFVARRLALAIVRVAGTAAAPDANGEDVGTRVLAAVTSDGIDAARWAPVGSHRPPMPLQ